MAERFLRFSKGATAMPHEAYLRITGEKQGKFKGESPRSTDNDQWMEVVAFSMDLESPRDLSTGQASGRRQYKPVTVVKAWGAASPQILTACATNEVLTQVVFQFIKTNPNGEQYVFQTVSLINAAISQVFRFMGDPETNHTPKSSPSGNTDTHELERVSLTFQKIVVEDTDGKTTFSDDWSTPV